MHSVKEKVKIFFTWSMALTYSSALSRLGKWVDMRLRLA